jgi:hypothetical protein
MAMNWFNYDDLYEVTGADISTWQRRPNEEIDFDLLVSRINFLWIRCLYAAYEDGDFQYYMSKLEKYPDLPVGFYQFLKVRKSSTAMKNQFNALKRIVEEFGLPSKGILLDVESNPDNLDKMAFGRGYKTDYPKRAKLFIARYITSIPTPLDRNIGLPKDWADLNNPPYGVKWVEWQFSADGNNLGEKFGVHSSAIDLIRFNGDRQDFKNLFGVYPRKETNMLGGDPEPEPEPDPDPEPEIKEFIHNKATCLINTLNVRKGPSTSYPIVEKIYLGNIVEVLETYEVSNQFWVRIGRNQWAAMDYFNNKFLEYLK